MNKYINVDELLNRLPDDLPYKASVKRVLTQAPDADVVEVVRCKDCKHYFDGCCYVSTRTNKGCYPRVNVHSCRENDFCSYGERKEDDELH